MRVEAPMYRVSLRTACTLAVQTETASILLMEAEVVSVEAGRAIGSEADSMAAEQQELQQGRP